MSRREADRFEDALQQADRGQEVDPGLRPLAETVRLVTALAEPPPAPAYALAPGRQRFLAAAATYRAQSTRNRPARLPWALRLGMAAVAAVLVFGVLLGAGQAVADSLPGEPLHGAELALEQVRLALTFSARSRAEYRVVLARERLDEIASMAEEGRSLDEPVLARAEQQLLAALREAARLGDLEAAPVLERLELAVQHRQRTMAAIMEGLPELDQVRLQETFQVMERVRQEAQSGQADPEGLRERLRQGMPANPPDPGSGAEPSDARQGPGLDPEIHPSLGPQPSEEPLGQDEEDTRPVPDRQPTAQEKGGDESGRGVERRLQPTAEATRESEGHRARPRPTDTDTARDETGIGPRPRPRSTEEAMGGDQGSADPRLDPRPTDSATGTACPDPQPSSGVDEVDEHTDAPGPGPQPPDGTGEGDGPAPQPPDDGRERDGRDGNPGPKPPTDGDGEDHRGDDSGTGSQPPDDRGEEGRHNGEAAREPGKGP